MNGIGKGERQKQTNKEKQGSFNKTLGFSQVPSGIAFPRAFSYYPHNTVLFLLVQIIQTQGIR